MMAENGHEFKPGVLGAFTNIREIIALRRLVEASDASNTDSAAGGVGNAKEERDFSTVALAASFGFVCVFWSLITICFGVSSIASKRRLQKEVARLRAQGHEVQLKDLQSKKKDAGERKAAKTAAYDEVDDEADWVDEEEENMSDREEIIRRTWQWKTLEFLTSIKCMTFVLTVVFVDLIVLVCTLALDPSPKESRDVEIFGLAALLFFLAEILLRMNTFVFVHGSLLKFFGDPFNSIDSLIVLIDVAFFVAINIAFDVYSDEDSNGSYAPVLRVVRAVRLLRLFRVGRAVRVMKKLIGKDTSSDIEEPSVDLEAIASQRTSSLVDLTVDELERLVLNDLLARALRLEQASWYHFSADEQKRIRSVFELFSASAYGLHRTDVYASLRRFGCKVSVTQARFLVQEFDSDGTKGTFSLTQFVTICARAQVVARYESTATSAAVAGEEQVDSPAHRGLSMIEVRALVDVFDDVDGRKQRNGNLAQQGILFTDFPGDGLISKQHLFTAIKNGGYNPTLAEMSGYMKTFDPHGTGWISKQDFLIVMGRVPTAQGTFSSKQYAKVVQLFDMYDANGTGLLSFTDLKALMWRLDLNLRKGAAALIVDRLFPAGINTPLDKQTVVSILSHAKARREQYVRGGVGIPQSFSPVLDGVEVGEDYSRVPRVPPGVLTGDNRALVKQVFAHFDASGSGTIPRYLFKKCLRMLGFYQAQSTDLDAVARKIPAHRDGRMDFPEFFALVGFVVINGKRGVFGKLVGTAFETTPAEPEAIEGLLAHICDPAFVRQFSGGGGVLLGKALPVVAAYVDEAAPSAVALYEWMDELVRAGGGEVVVGLPRFSELVHDGGEKYYAQADAKASAFHRERLYRWVGDFEAHRCADAFALYTDKSSVLSRSQLEQLLVDLGYPVASHEGSKAVLSEFSHPKDKTTVLFPELLHCLKTLAVVRFKAEAGRGDCKVNSKGVVVVLTGEGAAAVTAAEETASSANATNPLHQEDMRGVDVEEVEEKGSSPQKDDATLMAFEAEKKKRSKDSKAPAGGYMLVTKNLMKKKLKKVVRAKDEVDEEGIVKPKSAYELFVLTNPTADQLELATCWDTRESDKGAFEVEANAMIKAYDDVKSGTLNKEAANEILKRQHTSSTAKIKGGKQAKAAAKEAAARSNKDADAPPPTSDDEESGGDNNPDLIGDFGEVATTRPLSRILAEEKTRGGGEETKNGGGDLGAASGAAAAAPLAVVEKSFAAGAVEVQVEHTQSLAVALPPAPPPADKSAVGPRSKAIELRAQRPAAAIVPPGLSATGMPAELTHHASSMKEAEPKLATAGSRSHLASNMGHIAGPVTRIAPPPPPANPGNNRRVAGMSPTPDFAAHHDMALSMPIAPQFATGSFAGGSSLLPPPPPASSGFRR